MYDQHIMLFYLPSPKGMKETEMGREIEEESSSTHNLAKPLLKTLLLHSKNTKEEEKREAINIQPIHSHKKQNGEGRRRGSLHIFWSRGRGRGEEEDDVLGFSWDASNLHM